jgi:hypothetical protein
VASPSPGTNGQQPQKYDGPATQLEGVPDSFLAGTGVTLAEAGSPSPGMLSRDQVVDRFTNGNPPRVIDALFRKVTFIDGRIRPDGSRLASCDCWIVSFRPGEILRPAGGPAIDGPVPSSQSGPTIDFGYAVLDPMTAERIAASDYATAK